MRNAMAKALSGGNYVGSHQDETRALARVPVSLSTVVATCDASGVHDGLVARAGPSGPSHWPPWHAERNWARWTRAHGRRDDPQFG
eukprot:CAMPEP_0174357146 /NCGR_PEP_ID=MMETSP0811_2-20130205/34320_1 /TAXON_ID=73025 ORGANISM="Eutreptiella gymnastica-like, Strain CCMP1594" /NCGR_SAMPLE_ID=MMETSP0811_2 /ASSEMBLY_ACC=CAM_ASM_000667 /LENGTH=85 /DNA_ID=CAMNT_0015489711 /DNA_START=112 /DNA_END=370 /DNA_ORIENTATION=+